MNPLFVVTVGRVGGREGLVMGIYSGYHNAKTVAQTAIDPKHMGEDVRDWAIISAAVVDSSPMKCQDIAKFERDRG